MKKGLLFEVQGDPSILSGSLRVVADDFGDAEKKYKRFAANPPADCSPKPSKDVIAIKFVGLVIV